VHGTNTIILGDMFRL